MFGIIRVLVHLVFYVHKDVYNFRIDKVNRAKERGDFTLLIKRTIVTILSIIQFFHSPGILHRTRTR